MKSQKPIISTPSFDIFKAASATELLLPYIGTLRAGFPSPADDFSGERIDLNRLCIRHPEATYFAKAKGTSMNKDFEEDDLLVIDASLDYSNNYIAMIFLDGDFTIKRIRKTRNKCYLESSNKDYPDIEITEDSKNLIFGIVTWSFRKHT
ncbi:MAG: translesion error-prone DNA polymerase V autoproteolytic subunit [Porphyromonadaceae bacterium]|jgi:DNA polymerase V|nr:translesion error-prone DNA polymerase V autoproteolytic subunit [Porphyromonadaceae bacterium]